MVGKQGVGLYHVFESELCLPKFCMYAPADPEALPAAGSSVTIDISERPARSVFAGAAFVDASAIHNKH